MDYAGWFFIESSFIEKFLRFVEISCGLFYFVFGLDGFLKKIPLPEPSEKAKKFLLSLEEAVFVFPTIKIIEIFSGVCFVFSFLGPLAWGLLTPIVFNIFLYHLILNRREYFMPFLILLMHLLIFYKYKHILLKIFFV